MHLNSTARFTLIGTLNMWRNSFYAAFIAYNDANIDLRNEFHVLFTRNTQFSSTLATIYTMYEFQSYVIFTPLFKICFFSNSHACTSEFQPRSQLSGPNQKHAVKRSIIVQAIDQKTVKFFLKCITSTMVRLNYEVCSA